METEAAAYVTNKSGFVLAIPDYVLILGDHPCPDTLWINDEYSSLLWYSQSTYPGMRTALAKHDIHISLCSPNEHSSRIAFDSHSEKMDSATRDDARC